MPHLLDTDSRTDDLVNAVHDLIARGGVAALSYRALSRMAGISPSSLHDHFPEMSHLIKIAAHRLSLRRIAFFEAAHGSQRLHRMIPRDDLTLDLAVVWLALLDHGRVEPMLSYVLTEAREAELALIREALHQGGLPDPDPANVDAMGALLEGLASLRTVAESPISYECAQAALRAVMTSLGVETCDETDGEEASGSDRVEPPGQRRNPPQHDLVEHHDDQQRDAEDR